MKKIIYIFTLLFSIHYYTALFSAEEVSNVEAFQEMLVNALYEYDTVQEKIGYLNEIVDYYGQFPHIPLFGEYKKIGLDLKKKLLGKKR